MNGSASLRAVIFDLDGLLVDSEPLQFRAYRDAFQAHGVSFAESDWRTWHELGASASAWIEYTRSDVDPEAVRAAKKALYDGLIASELTLKPGARDLVEELASNGVRLSVASGSRVESIEACLARFGLADYFEGLFSATLTARKKPYPDIFDLAVGEMDVSADEAVVIEDSPAGLQAALTANLTCVVCPDAFVSRDPDEFEQAALLVSSLSQLSTDVLDQVLWQSYRSRKSGG